MRHSSPAFPPALFPVLLAVLGLSGCLSTRDPDEYIPDPGPPVRPLAVLRPADTSRLMEVTAYCPCDQCCGWEVNWRGVPVFATGRNRGQPKTVGLTASGARARIGTIAADPRYHPFGTTMYVRGYGWGVVEDRGSAITGDKLDLFFPTHGEALRWGRRRVDVLIWKR